MKRYQVATARAALISLVTFGVTLWLGAPHLAVIPLFVGAVFMLAFLLLVFYEEWRKP